MHGTTQSIYSSLLGSLIESGLQAATAADIYELFAETECAGIADDASGATVTFEENCVYSGRRWSGDIHYTLHDDAVDLAGTPTIAGYPAVIEFRAETPTEATDGAVATVNLTVEGFIRDYSGIFDVAPQAIVFDSGVHEGLAATGLAEWTDEYDKEWQLTATKLVTRSDRGLPVDGSFALELPQELLLNGEYHSISESSTNVDVTDADNDTTYSFSVGSN